MEAQPSSETQQVSTKASTDPLGSEDAPVTSSKKQKKKQESVSFESPSKVCIGRIQSDIKKLFREPIDGIWVTPDETKVNVCHALILGPSDTPYEYGFFLFKMEFPDSYPMDPPRVTFLTTGGGRVRFNPNLYSCGKVCLSILGTWNGPPWTPALTIGSVLLSIRSLLNDYPYRNEPSFEETPIEAKEMIQYNQYIRYQTLRIAVADMVSLSLCQNEVIPRPLANHIQRVFLEESGVEYCKHACEEYGFLNGRTYKDRFSSSSSSGTFDFSAVSRLLEQVERDAHAAAAATE